MEENKIGKIEYILFTDPIFNNIWKVGNSWLQNSIRFKKDLERVKLFESLDKKDFDPIYYCYAHKRLEDGTHRSRAMNNKGYTGYETFIGRTCWKIMDNLYKSIKTLIDKKNIKTKDADWTLACKDKKWSVLKGVDFSEKSYLDVGSNSGYSTFKGWNAGAIKVVGIEKRKEIYDISEEMKIALKAKEITFYNADWLLVRKEIGDFDIVSCMGLMHYFSEKDFDFILEDLCSRCRRTLILELRLWDDPAINHKIIGSQTLITISHLTDLLTVNNFKIISTTNIETNIPGKRELWIMDRI